MLTLPAFYTCISINVKSAFVEKILSRYLILASVLFVLNCEALVVYL